MTDGAARLSELLLAGALQQGQDPASSQEPSSSCQQQQLEAALRDAFSHLTSRDPELFWTSGQVRLPGLAQPGLPAG